MKNQINILEIKKRFLNGYRSTKTINNVIIKEKNVERREAQEASAVQTLQLKITTDTDSPIYKDFFGNDYVEQIDSNAYDETLAQVEKGKTIVYSFSDHYMDTANVISSTQREATKLYKDSNNDYIMEMELDPKNELHARLIELTKNKELNANSFIFLPEEIEIHEGGREDVDYVVVQKKGKLLSIDPVLFPFYPTNEIKLKGKDFMSDKTKKDLELEAKAKEEAKLAKEAEEKAKVEAQAKADKEAAEKKAADEAKEAEAKAKAEKEAEEAAEKEAEDKKIVDEAETELEKDSKFKALSIKEQRALFAKIAKREVTIKEVISNLNKEEQEQRDLIAQQLKEMKGQNMSEKEQKQKREALLDKFAKRGIGSVTEFGDAKNIDEIKEQLSVALAERNEKLLAEFDITDDELKLFALTRSGLTGETASTGAQIIPVSTDPNVVGQSVIQTPEFNGASRMAMSGLEEKKVPVDVDTFGVANKKGEGVDADEDTTTVVKVQFTPQRYAITFDYNPLLATHAGIVSQKTRNQQNKITNAWLADLYSGLLTHKGATLASLVAASGYTGGITSDAVTNGVTVETASTVSDNDFDELILKAEDRYGVVNEGEFVALMKPSTWTQIKKAAKANGNAALIRVAKDRTYYGNVEVIVRSQYPEIANGAGKIPVVLTKKSSIKIYGGVQMVQDSIEQSFKKSLNTRKVEGRGEVKLCDPHYNTFVIVDKA